MYFTVKIFITAFVVAATSELARRSTLFAAMIVSLPLTSILAFIWLYVDTKDVRQVAELSTSILWMVIPSLLFFATFPWLVKMGLGFVPALLIACALMSVGYGVFIYLMQMKS
jgi:hypothetical protein